MFNNHPKKNFISSTIPSQVSSPTPSLLSISPTKRAASSILWPRHIRRGITQPRKTCLPAGEGSNFPRFTRVAPCFCAPQDELFPLPSCHLFPISQTGTGAAALNLLNWHWLDSRFWVIIILKFPPLFPDLLLEANRNNLHRKVLQKPATRSTSHRS